jgi:predicted dinucleotide-binding enzyme
MKIGILGSGDVGRSVGAGFAALGHDVMLASRTPESDKVAGWVKQHGPHASAGTFSDAAAHAEIALLATPWNSTEEVIRLADPRRLAGKIVMDAVNPLDFSKGFPGVLAIGRTDSAGEQIQRWLPDSHVVKVFNIVGFNHMFKPDFPGGPPDMWICGNDAGAKQKVTEILSWFGWPAIDLGGIELARILEPASLLWIVTGAKLGTRNIALKLLRK